MSSETTGPERLEELRHVTTRKSAGTGAWKSAVVLSTWGERYTVWAKVYLQPSEFGIGGGHVSKLVLKRDASDTVFNYDRGLDFSEVDEELVSDVVEALERRVTAEQEA